MKINKKHVKSADPFFKKILEDKEVRVKYEHEKIQSQIAVAVREIRTNAKLTQANLAKRVGTSQSVIARLESGKDKRIPSMPFLVRIGDVCKKHFEFAYR